MTKKGRDVCVIGVGMTKFERCNTAFQQLAQQAGRDALKDAGIKYTDVEQAYVGYVSGISTSGQQAVYGIGMTGIPVYNVNNNCSTGSTALYLGYQAISAGLNECVLALGFEKMQKGALAPSADGSIQKKPEAKEEEGDKPKKKKVPIAPKLFGDAGRAHMKKYGTTKEQFAKVSVKNHGHSVNNPRSQFQEAHTVEEVLASREVYDPLTVFQCCPTSDGSAAAILCSEDFAKKMGISDPVKIVGMTMTTDKAEDFAMGAIGMVGFGMAKRAGEQVYEQSGIGIEDVDVIELHDCFTTNEILTYEALGMAKEGEGPVILDEGQVTYGGKWVVNPSGGLLSKGHPLGATGLAQCSELYWQLNGQAEKRQVEGAKVALQHNLGLGGACVVTMYKK